MIQKYKLVMFDFDGTLADTLPWCRSMFNQLADRHRFRRVEEHEYEEFRELSGRELLRRLGLPLWKLPLAVRSMRALMNEHARDLKLFPGTAHALKTLSNSGILLGIVTSNSRENVDAILGNANGSLVNFYSCGASMFGKAPKLRAVVRASKVPSAEALYVGDELRDADAAREAGIAFGAVAWGQHRPASLKAAGPAEFFETIGDLGRLA